VVNIISDWFIEAANHTCGDFDRGVDEMALAGLTPAASVKVRPPRVAEAAVQLECKLRTVHEVQDRWARTWGVSGLGWQGCCSSNARRRRAPWPGCGAPRPGGRANTHAARPRTRARAPRRNGAPSSAVVIGEVVLAHVAEAVTGRSPSGKLVVDPLKLRAVSRLGGVTYGLATELFDIPRPDKEGRYLPPATG
jgi:flavin reductase (DIM6/NTAB) family NADH-FMN oxidoreductase RutF